MTFRTNGLAGLAKRDEINYTSIFFTWDPPGTDIMRNGWRKIKDRLGRPCFFFLVRVVKKGPYIPCKSQTSDVLRDKILVLLLTLRVQS